MNSFKLMYSVPLCTNGDEKHDKTNTILKLGNESVQQDVLLQLLTDSYSWGLLQHTLCCLLIPGLYPAMMPLAESNPFLLLPPPLWLPTRGEAAPLPPPCSTPLSTVPLHSSHRCSASPTVPEHWHSLDPWCWAGNCPVTATVLSALTVLHCTTQPCYGSECSSGLFRVCTFRRMNFAGLLNPFPQDLKQYSHCCDVSEHQGKNLGFKQKEPSSVLLLAGDWGQLQWAAEGHCQAMELSFHQHTACPCPELWRQQRWLGHAGGEQEGAALLILSEFESWAIP